MPIEGMKVWYVELEPGVWLADGEGDPPRTLDRVNACSWLNRIGAEQALDQARTYHPFPNATLQLLF